MIENLVHVLFKKGSRMVCTSVVEGPTKNESGSTLSLARSIDFTNNT